MPQYSTAAPITMPKVEIHMNDAMSIQISMGSTRMISGITTRATNMNPAPPPGLSILKAALRASLVLLG